MVLNHDVLFFLNDKNLMLAILDKYNSIIYHFFFSLLPLLTFHLMVLLFYPYIFVNPSTCIQISYIIYPYVAIILQLIFFFIKILFSFYFTTFGCILISFNTDISRNDVLGIPSSVIPNLIFFIATVFPVLLSSALYTIPYVPFLFYHFYLFYLLLFFLVY